MGRMLSACWVPRRADLIYQPGVGRTPDPGPYAWMTAMTAATLDILSGGVEFTEPLTYAGGITHCRRRMADQTCLLGPVERVAGRLREFAAAGVTPRRWPPEIGRLIN